MRPDIEHMSDEELQARHTLQGEPAQRMVHLGRRIRLQRCTMLPEIGLRAGDDRGADQRIRERARENEVSKD